MAIGGQELTAGPPWSVEVEADGGAGRSLLAVPVWAVDALVLPSGGRALVLRSCRAKRRPVEEARLDLVQVAEQARATALRNDYCSWGIVSGATIETLGRYSCEAVVALSDEEGEVVLFRGHTAASSVTVRKALSAALGGIELGALAALADARISRPEQLAYPEALVDHLRERAWAKWGGSLDELPVLASDELDKGQGVPKPSWKAGFTRSRVSPLVFNVRAEHEGAVLGALQEEEVLELRENMIFGNFYLAWPLLDGVVILLDRYGLSWGDLPSGIRVIGPRPLRLLCLLTGLRPPSRRLVGEHDVPTPEQLRSDLEGQRRRGPDELEQQARRAMLVDDPADLKRAVRDLFGGGRA